MKKRDILKKLDTELENGTNYTFLVLDMREYPHPKGVFKAW